MTPQKRTWINRRRREQRAAKKASQSAQIEASSTTTSQSAQTEASSTTTIPVSDPTTPMSSSLATPSMSCPSGYQNRNTKYKAVSKVRNSMPESPAKYAAVVDSLARIKSPRKRAALTDLGFLATKSKKQLQFSNNIEEELKDICQNLKSSRTKKNRQRRAVACKVLMKSRTGSLSHLRKKFGVSWQFLVKNVSKNDDDDDDDDRKKRKDALPQETCEAVQKFFSRGDISREDPSSSSVNAKTQEPSRFMEKTLKEAHVQFQQETNRRFSFSKFASLRPKRTKTVKYNRLKTCLCEYCANVEMKKEAVNKLLTKHGHHDKLLGTKYDVADMTLCDKNQCQHFHKKKCIDRSCTECGVAKLRRHLQDVLDSHADAPVSWTAWQLENQVYHNRDGQEATTSKRALVNREGPLDQLVTELEENLASFAAHLANAQWQHQQFSHLADNLPEGWVLLCMDFGENFSCFYQDEAQGAHWSKQQVTVHPVVAIFHCPEDGEIMRETFCFVSPDLKHDSHAVQHFSVGVIHSLQGSGVVCNKVIHFSDGCAGQYKGKTNFVDASFSLQDTGCELEKHFFGSRHGKGPCDAEIGVLKRIAGLAVRRRKAVIASAQDLFVYARDNLTKPQNRLLHSHRRRSFVFVPLGTINREREDRTSGVKTLPGTRSLHGIRGQHPYLVSFRERSCFCLPCVQKEGRCQNLDFCGAWKEFSMKVNRRRGNGNNPPCAQVAADDQPAPAHAMDQPAPADHPAPDQPAPADHPAPLDLPAPADLPALNQPAPTDAMDQHAPVVQPTPVDQPTSDDQPTPADQPTSDDQPTPADAVDQPAGSAQKLPVKVGDFVLVTVYNTSGAQSKDFVAFVKSLEASRAFVSFLRKQGGSFCYPDNPDESFVLLKDFKEILPEPHFDRRGHFFFQ
ncbi:uncharacterized protein [Littorina saxatilis]|uniref:Uncharacterized protein n=1 Tax=Littorina saxatilis TaxID=31220 RepID=A0AAN9GBY2_9CAEN